MKRFIISFFIGFILIILLGCSIYTSSELIVTNKSSRNILLRITRQERWSEIKYTEEIFLRKEQSIDLKPYISRNHIHTPEEYIIYFIIYNENMEIIKEFNREMLLYLFSNLEMYASGNTGKFYFIITDELLE